MNFRSLFSEYDKRRKAKAFGLWVDEQFAELSSDDSNFTGGQKVSIVQKGANAFRGTLNFESSLLQNQLRELQVEREEIASIERETNATNVKKDRKEQIDRAIDDLRDRQADLNDRRMLANQLLGVVGTLEPNGEWSEQEKTESSAILLSGFTREE